MTDNVIDDGGPAFPVQWTDTHEGTIGMTKRDVFAGRSVSGIILGADIAFLMGKREGRITTSEAARDAVRVADSLIAELRKGVPQ